MILRGVVMPTWADTPIPNVTAVVESSPNGSTWTQVGAAQVSGSGIFFQTVTANSPVFYRYRWTGDGTFAGSTSGALQITPVTVQPTSISIRTNATTTSIGKTPILSGSITPNGIVGKVIVVYVRKPGKSYWTYSSNRVAYSRYGVPSWQYKYYFKSGMAKGVYTYKAAIPAYTGYLPSVSPTTVAIRVR
jgi:hypothetical protein